MVQHLLGSDTDELAILKKKLIDLHNLQESLIEELKINDGSIFPLKEDERKLLTMIPEYITKIESFPKRRQQIDERLLAIKRRLRETSE